MLGKDKFILVKNIELVALWVATTNLNQSKELANALRELALNYKEVSKTLSGVADATKPLTGLIGEPGEKAKGSRLIAAGIALIAFPDPTISDLVGATLVAAGIVRNRMRQTTVVDVCREFLKVTNDLGKLREELTINTGYKVG